MPPAHAHPPTGAWLQVDVAGGHHSQGLQVGVSLNSFYTAALHVLRTGLSVALGHRIHAWPKTSQALLSLRRRASRVQRLSTFGRLQLALASRSCWGCISRGVCAALVSTVCMRGFEHLGRWQLPLLSLLLSLCLCEAVLVQQQQVHRPVLADEGYLCAYVRAGSHVSNARGGL